MAIFGGSQVWLVASLVLAGCEAGGIGDPCVPEDEYQRSFGGFDVNEVNVETRSFQCETRTCLVNHFQGRVTCPYGQSEEDLSLPPDDARRCRLPGRSGVSESDAVSVMVKPERLDRLARDAVYCSCRCDGPDKNVHYCDCPNGFSCAKLIDDLGFGPNELTGSYCVRDGTKFANQVARECSRDARECGGEGKNP